MLSDRRVWTEIAITYVHNCDLAPVYNSCKGRSVTAGRDGVDGRQDTLRANRE